MSRQWECWSVTEACRIEDIKFGMEPGWLSIYHCTALENITEGRWGKTAWRSLALPVSAATASSPAIITEARRLAAVETVAAL